MPELALTLAAGLAIRFWLDKRQANRTAAEALRRAEEAERRMFGLLSTIEDYSYRIAGLEEELLAYRSEHREEVRRWAN